MSKYFFRDPKCETLVSLSSPVQFVGLSALLPKTLSRPLNQGRSLGLLQQSGDRLSWKQFGPSLAPALPGPLSPMDSGGKSYQHLIYPQIILCQYAVLCILSGTFNTWLNVFACNGCDKLSEVNFFITWLHFASVSLYQVARWVFTTPTSTSFTSPSTNLLTFEGELFRRRRLLLKRTVQKSGTKLRSGNLECSSKGSSLNG